ncbi:MAG: M48 family metallopeptidase [Candidatus Wildermuthbacteria bacterium]|nr:M48 family metallopeptidase [Candidatus Wildermuthbacteria bacterium]
MMKGKAKTLDNLPGKAGGVAYVLYQSKRAKRVSLTVHPDACVSVTAPMFFDEAVIERFMREKISWLFSKMAFFSRHKFIVSKKGGKKEYARHKEQARALVLARVEHFNRFYGFCIAGIAVKNQKTRWGSCSRRGNLNFNYRIVLLSQRLGDYIVAHELCHLQEQNHAKKFWDLVARTIPDYADRRKELKRRVIA